MIWITQNNFYCLGDIAKHCDLPKLCIAIAEAQNFDLMPLLCSDLYLDIDSKLNETAYQDLLKGGSFIGCGNKQSYHFGLKTVLAYYAYSRYILINGFNDTPNGMVAKTNSFSMPTPLKELQAYSDKYRNMGFDAWQMTKKYLCKNKDTFTKFDATNCNCGCENCGEKTKKQTGIKSFIISKYD